MFVNRLQVKLEVTIGAKTVVVPAGNIKGFDLRIDTFGFSGTIDWWIISLQSRDEDELFPEFVKKDLVKVKLTIDRTFDRGGNTTDPLVLPGLVTDKWVSERAFSELQGDVILHRHYGITFADRAAVLWGQHFPTAIYADKTWKDVLEAHKPDGAKLSYDWTKVSDKHAVQSLALGVDGNLASFYDYVVWVLDRDGAGMFFDPETQTYKITDKKPPATKAEPLPVDDIEAIETRFPPTDRATVAILNSHTEAKTKKKPITNAQAVTGLARSYLLTTAIESDVTKRGDLEGLRHRAREPETWVSFARYPSITFKPGSVVDFSEDWSAQIFQHGKKYRVYRVNISAFAESQEATDDDGDDGNSYELEITANLEVSSDPTFRLPEAIEPTWPFFVEGKIVSEVGKADEGTYQIYPDSKTAIDYYRVKVPLYDLQVIAPYNPIQVTGHFYFPAYKDERVLLSIEHRSAWIKRFLDWRPGARLPKETQGDHILLGKKAKDETSIRHVYRDAKPVLSIQRTSAKDTQHIEVSEGIVRLTVKEEDES